MSTHAVSARQPKAEASPRSIVLRTRGHVHGAVTRLVSPNDLGQMIKPFVFLDYFEADPANAPKFGFHPHSGIATLTLILSGQAFYKETTEREGVINSGGVEWMRASSGVCMPAAFPATSVSRAFSSGSPCLRTSSLPSPKVSISTPRRFSPRGPRALLQVNMTGSKALSAHLWA